VAVGDPSFYSSQRVETVFYVPLAPIPCGILWKGQVAPVGQRAGIMAYEEVNFQLVGVIGQFLVSQAHENGASNGSKVVIQ
jgi:hypothetical protein